MRRILCLMLTLVLLCGCAPAAPESTGSFYYCRRDAVYSGTDGILAPEARNTDGELTEVLERFCQGPKDLSLRSPLPLGCRVLRARVSNGTLTIHFDETLGQLQGIDLTLAVGCIARTFLPLTDCTTLVLSAEGVRLRGQRYLTIRLEELDLEDNSLDRLHETYTLYYADRDRRYLIGQEVTVNLALEEDAKLFLLQKLLEPPEGLRSALPAVTQVLGVTTESGTCTVDLSTDFQRSRFPVSHAQLLSLMAVVNTLTALPDVERVEFTVDGDLLVRYGSIAISEPLQRDERLIGPVRKALGEQDGTIYLLHGEEHMLAAMPVRLSGSGSLAATVMERLLSDPGTNGFGTGIPAGTRVLDLKIEDRVCTLDLSGEYLQSGERLQFCNRVIAATLLEVNVISEVKITVNGAIPEGYDEDFFRFDRVKSDWFL